MIKKITLFAVCAIMLAGCAKDDSAEIIPGQGDTDKVKVSLNVGFAEGQFNTETGYEPMTRAGSDYKTLILGKYHLIVMKEIDGYWVVHNVLTPSFTGVSEYTGTLIYGQLPEHEVVMDLTPGTYTAMVCLNSHALNPNSSNFTPGTIVKQVGSNDPAPEAFFLKINGNQAPEGEKEKYDHWVRPWGYYLSNEIFSGNAQFTVTKGDNLHNPYTPVRVTVPVTRKVAKIQFYGRQSPEIQDDFFVTGNHIRWDYKITSTTKPFADGIDLWGDVYFNTARPRMELDTACWWRINQWKQATRDSEVFNYAYFADGMGTHNPFVLADPRDQDGIPFTINDIWGSETSGFRNYVCYETYDKLLKCNRLNAVSFKATGEMIGTEAIVEHETDSGGVRIDVTNMFPPDLEY